MGPQGPAAVVDEAVVEGAEQQQVGEVGRATVGPVLDVVCVQVAGAVAAGEPAVAIAELQRASQLGRYLAGSSPDVGRVAAGVVA